VEAEILRAFCSRNRCYGIAGLALTARNAIAAACESEAGGSRSTMAARLRMWGSVLHDAAAEMEARDNG
jgi:hypothetical protein